MTTRRPSTHEITELARASAAARAARERYALATIVRVQGSAYRRPGARMLITTAGHTTGIISGGCLDADLRERAAQVMDSGRPTVVRYDTTSEEDLVWGLGLGCNGVVDVLLEPGADCVDDLLQTLASAVETGRGAVLATVIHTTSSDTPLGSRLLLSSDGEVASAESSHALSTMPPLVADLQAAARTGGSCLTRYRGGAGVETFIEVVAPRVPLVIIGAGADALPLVGTAQALGWHTTVVDTQARAVSLERFAQADAVLLHRPEDVTGGVVISDSAAVVLMTHNYGHDRELLPGLLRSAARYVGVLGSRQRAERLLSDMALAAIEPAILGKLHAPIGLDLGAEAPPEIALAIVAEIVADQRGRAAGHLRDSRGSIHAGSPSALHTPATGEGPTRATATCRIAATA